MLKIIRPPTTTADHPASLTRLICDSLPALIAYIDADQRYRFVNRSYEEWFGLAREEIEGRRVVELLGWKRYREIQPDIDRALGGQITRFTTRRPDRRGVPRDFEANLLPRLGPDGRALGLYAFILDVTERKRIEADSRENEERYRTLFREMTEGFALCEMMFDGEGRPIDFRILDINPAAARIAGLDPEFLRGRTLRQIFPSAEQAWFDACGHAVRTGEPMRLEGYTTALDRWLETYSFSLDGMRFGQFFHDITERKKAEQQRELLLAELNHRVKNTLATVQSIMMQTARGSASLDQFQESFGKRLQALSEAHDLLTRDSWITTSLGDVVRQTLAPHGSASGDRITIDGPTVLLKPNAAIILNMAFHELATNAAKYGALSTPEGRVAVTWSIVAQPSPAVAVSWVEQGGPPIQPPTRRGFGSRVIEGGVAHEIEGEVHLDFPPTGLHCHMRIPVSSKVTLP